MESLGHDGLNKLLAGYEDKSAKAVCTFAYCKGPGEEPVLFQGVTEVCFPRAHRCVFKYKRYRTLSNKYYSNRARSYQPAVRPSLVSISVPMFFSSVTTSPSLDN